MSCQNPDLSKGVTKPLAVATCSEESLSGGCLLGRTLKMSDRERQRQRESLQFAQREEGCKN